MNRQGVSTWYTGLCYDFDVKYLHALIGNKEVVNFS